MPIGIVRLSLQVIPKDGNALVQSALLQAFGSLHDSGIRAPANLLFNRSVGFVFQARMLDDQRSKHAKDKAADVRPMCHAGHLTNHGSIENFREQPQREKRIRRRLEAEPHKKGRGPHVYLQLWKTNEERSHERSDRSRSAETRHDAMGIRKRVNLRSHDAAEKVKRGIHSTAPILFQNKTSQPQE